MALARVDTSANVYNSERMPSRRERVVAVVRLLAELRSEKEELERRLRDLEAEFALLVPDDALPANYVNERLAEGVRQIFTEAHTRPEPMNQKILRFLRASPVGVFSAEDIHKNIGPELNIDTLRTTIARMVNSSVIYKHQAGKYSATPPLDKAVAS